jgi:hypothetical protein
MLRQTAGLALTFALLASLGCTTCPHRAAFDALATEADQSCTYGQRNRVIAVLVGPESVFDLGGVGTFSKSLNEAGFARIYRGGILHANWLSREAQRTHEDDPETRFVVIGYDLGCRTARNLAVDLTHSGVPVDAVVLLDPLAVDSNRPLPANVELTVVRSHGWTGNPVPDAFESIVPGVGHYDLLASPETLGTVVAALSTVAQRVAVPSEVLAANRPAHLGPEWDFVLGPYTIATVSTRESSTVTPADPKPSNQTSFR